MDKLKDKISEFENMTNNEIFFEIKKIEADYDSTKLRVLEAFDDLVSLEHLYHRANKIIIDRLKGK